MSLQCCTIYTTSSYASIHHLNLHNVTFHLGHSKSSDTGAAQNVTITNGNDGENHKNKTQSVINQYVYFEEDNLVLFPPWIIIKDNFDLEDLLFLLMLCSWGEKTATY